MRGFASTESQPPTIATRTHGRRWGGEHRPDALGGVEAYWRRSGGEEGEGLGGVEGVSLEAELRWFGKARVSVLSETPFPFVRFGVQIALKPLFVREKTSKVNPRRSIQIQTMSQPPGKSFPNALTSSPASCDHFPLFKKEALRL